ncbi:MAG: Sir2 family NAD-dependent protein deacetylase [Elusimicrobiales bacterium]|nr:Sir2 family NAD-dependent protein deacetylase [Elusimicrobiales bacterium]
MTLSNDIDLLSQKIISSNKILIFTGAGISTSSGIPDFRGPNGVWKNQEPVYYQEFISDDNKKRKYWEYKAFMWKYFKQAKTTFSHIFIKKLSDTGKVIGIVTQNIDDLHTKSGVCRDLILELHGNNSNAVCINCGKKTFFDDALTFFLTVNQLPRCNFCNGYLKPDVIMFGEPLDSIILNKAFSLAKKSDLVISIGSSLIVQPASFIPYEAKMKGAFYVIVNKGITQHDEICDLKIDAECDLVFKEVYSKISKSLNL